MIIIFRVPNKFLKLFFLFSLFSSELIWEMPPQTSVLSFFKWKILCLLHRSLGYQEERNRRSDSKRCKKRWTWWTSSCYFSPICTLILDVQNFGSVFLSSNFWYRCNLRCYWQSQMLHCKIRITLASEVFTKKYYALPKHLRFLRALWYSYWMSHMYFDISKHRKRKW